MGITQQEYQRLLARTGRSDPNAPKKTKNQIHKDIQTGYFKGLSHEQIMETFNGGVNGLFIPYNVPSSKNSKQAYVRLIKGKYVPGITESDICKDYRKMTKSYWENYRSVWEKMVGDREWPVKVSFFFVRNRKMDGWDYINISQIVQDIMSQNKWIPDDSVKYIIPDFADGWAVDKYNPGVILKIID